MIQDIKPEDGKKGFPGKQGHGDSNPGLMAENHLS